FEVTLPNNRQFSLGIAPALGFALLGPIVPRFSHQLMSEVLTMFAAGACVATLMRLSMKKDLQLVDSGTHLIALAGGTAVYQGFAALSSKMAASGTRSSSTRARIRAPTAVPGRHRTSSRTCQ